MPVNTTVNLFRGRKIQIGDKLLGWSVSAGRGIVICTELVALVAFGYRFVLDRQIIDLHDETKQKLIIVQAFATNEKIYRNTQTRLSLIKKGNNANAQMQSRLKDIVAFFPPDMSINSVTLATDTLRVDAEFSSLASATDFVNKIKSYPQATGVTLDKIDNKPSQSVIDIVITATLKKVPSVL